MGQLSPPWMSPSSQEPVGFWILHPEKSYGLPDEI